MSAAIDQRREGQAATPGGGVITGRRQVQARS
jgi:hypothetical protein